MTTTTRHKTRSMEEFITRPRANVWVNSIELTRLAAKKGGCIWARDVLVREDASSTRVSKMYMCTGSVEEFVMRHMLPCNVRDRHFYEVIEMEHPCRLYIDSDIEWSPLNRQHVGDSPEELEREIFAELRSFLRTEFADQWQWTGDDDDDVRVHCFDSSSEKKWSRHYIIGLPPHGTGVMRSLAHAGALIRRFRNHIIHKFGTVRDNSNKFFVWRGSVTEPHYRMHKGGLENKVFLFDLAVYTRDRQYRVLGSSKLRTDASVGGGDDNDYGRYLRPGVVGERSTQATRIHVPQTVDEVIDALVRAHRCHPSDDDVIYSVLEADGSEPRSSNHTLLHRPDIKDGDWRRYVENASPEEENDCNRWYDNYPFERIWEQVLLPLDDDDRQSTLLRSMAMTTQKGVIRRAGVFFENARQWRAHAQLHRPRMYHIGAVVVVSAASGNRVDLRMSDCAVRTREWTIDLDMGANERRTLCACGDAKKTCARCWPLAYRSAHFYLYLIRSLWACEAHMFFSGGRGVHVWLRPVSAAAFPCDRRLFYNMFLAPDVVRNALDCCSHPYVAAAERAGIRAALVPIDKSVFTDVRHLCKMPLAWHASSGRQATEIPIDEERVRDECASRLPWFFETSQ